MEQFLVNELKKELKPDEKRIKKIWSKIPRFFKILILLIAIIFLLFMEPMLLKQMGLITFSKNFNIHQSGKNIVQQWGNNNTAVLPGETQCYVHACSNFESENWIGKNSFVTVQENPWMAKSPSSLQLPGATTYYKDSVGNFTAKIFVTPQASKSANLVLAYGHFYRCIIGDSDYQLLTCQINLAYPKIPEDWSYFDTDGTLHGEYKRYVKRPFEQNKELEIRFEQREQDDKTIISIKLNNQEPAEWTLPQAWYKTTLSEQIGVGLIKTSYGETQATFKRFELSPQI